MGKFVIVAYRPRPGKEEQLLRLTREHLPILRSQGLATDRPSYIMKSADATIIEVFEVVEWDKSGMTEKSAEVRRTFRKPHQDGS